MNKLILGLVLLVGIGFAQQETAAEPAAVPALRLAGVFSDHMVLQRDAPVPMWGWAQAGDTVTVGFAGLKQTGKAGADGRWKLVLPNLRADSQPAVLTVTSARGDGTLEIKDVLVGDVWLCSGQSNMDFGLGGAENGMQDIATANFPGIRFFAVPHVVADTPSTDVKGQWLACSPQSANGIYAAAFYFATELHRKLDIPIGLLQAAWSGMPAEACTPREALEADPELRPILKRCYMDKAAFEAARKAYDAKLPVWQDPLQYADTGNVGEKQGWAGPDADLSRWGVAPLPMMFMHGEPALYMYGAFWFRRDVDIPTAWADKALGLDLGPITDFDTTYFNGSLVGATDADVKETAKTARSYTVPGKLVKAGRNVIAVRLYAKYGEPGFAAKPEEMRLTPADAKETAPLPLAGPWRYRVERGLPIKPPPRAPVAPASNYSPTKVYNGMIAPLAPFAIRGAIFYQGEHNAEYADQYRKLFPAMIAGWRKAWGQGDFPFLFVQIANWLYPQEEPADCTWAELRDVQRLSLAVPKTGMAVAIDLGEKVSIHPKKKQEVGHRLALAAEKVAYGMDIPCTGPLYRSMTIAGDRIRLTFDGVFGGLKAAETADSAGGLQGFTISGEDRRFRPAQAVIDGASVVVSSSEVAKPVAVRYGWQYNPRCNLVNGAGLPASPFRTDSWPFLLSIRETEPELP